MRRGERRRMPVGDGSEPIRLGLSKWESAELAESAWHTPSASTASAPGRSGGRRLRALVWLVLLLVLGPAALLVELLLDGLLEWGLERFEPWSSLVISALLGGFFVVCIVGFEASRRHRIRILPGPGRN